MRETPGDLQPIHTGRSAGNSLVGCGRGMKMCFVHYEILSVSKIRIKPCLRQRISPGAGEILGNARETGPERDKCRKIAALSGLEWEPFRWVFFTVRSQP